MQHNAECGMSVAALLRRTGHPGVVETQRLVLRRWREADRESLAAMNVDPIVVEHFPATQSAIETNEFIDDDRAQLRGAWLGVLGGRESVPRSVHRFRRPVAPEHHGFDMLDLDEVVAVTTHCNRTSRRVMEELGMDHDPADDPEHPKRSCGHRLQPFVLYRIGNAHRRAA